MVFDDINLQVKNLDPHEIHVAGQKFASTTESPTRNHLVQCIVQAVFEVVCDASVSGASVRLCMTEGQKKDIIPYDSFVIERLKKNPVSNFHYEIRGNKNILQI